MSKRDERHRTEEEPRTAAEQTEEELREAAASVGSEEDRAHGEAGDALNTSRAAQEDAHGE